ncbi:MAG TPA: hypothetical protein PLC61_07700, partial [Chitinophagales bacterium]|nr:hypothetical protein [Chitinophagales bacterium]
STFLLASFFTVVFVTVFLETALAFFAGAFSTILVFGFSTAFFRLAYLPFYWLHFLQLFL